MGSRDRKRGAKGTGNSMGNSRLLRFFATSRVRRRLHLTSFDPARHTVQRVREIVGLALDADTDGFLLGGSTGVDNAMVEDYSKVIRETIDARFPVGDGPPLILFPSSAATGVATGADGVLFLSLLNSRDVRYLIREQAKAAPFLPALGLEPIGCGMIMFEPGGTAGQVGKADLIGTDDWQRAVGFAAAAVAFGFPLIYLNAGSGSDQPASPLVIAAVSQVIDVPLIVGGGLSDAAKVRVAIEAGADVVVTGTAIEDNPDVGATLAEIIQTVHAARLRPVVE